MNIRNFVIFCDAVAFLLTCKHDGDLSWIDAAESVENLLITRQMQWHLNPT